MHRSLLVLLACITAATIISTAHASDADGILGRGASASLTVGAGVMPAEPFYVYA